MYLKNKFIVDVGSCRGMNILLWIRIRKSESDEDWLYYMNGSTFN